MRKTILFLAVAALAISVPANLNAAGIKVKFLGTAAAGGSRTAEFRQERNTRQSSILLDSRVLIDLTADALDLLPEGFCADCILYTHSHGDHYRPSVAVEMGIPKVYVHESWYDRALENFKAAAEKAGKPAPDVLPLREGRTVLIGDLAITPLPANHCTSYFDEQAVIYLVEKDSTRLLYATDTGGLMGRATRMAGIDTHLPAEQRKPITALIMEATMAHDDFRIFNHSSLEEVKRVVGMLTTLGTYKPAEGSKVYVTHRAFSLHDSLTPAELNANWPEPLYAPADGEEAEF